MLWLVAVAAATVLFMGLQLQLVYSQQQDETQTLTTYENPEYGFVFEYPATWHNAFDANEAVLNNYVVALADPFSNDSDGIETIHFHVNISDVNKYLDSDLHLRSYISEDYVKDQVNEVNESHRQTDAAIKGATSYEESDNPLWTLDNLKNTTLLISGENASRVQYVESFKGKQAAFAIFIFIVKDDKVYELSYYNSNPLTVPEKIPIAEKIFKSFRFV